MHPTRELAQSPLFQIHSEGLPLDDRASLAYQRAKAIGRTYDLTARDILELSPKFWQLHTDPIWSMDGAAGSLCTIQYSLCGGTLAMFSVKQPGLTDLIQQVLNFEVSGQFCLTEVGHGLDALSIETTATLLPDGEFELNTPSDGAAKFMPPTYPAGDPCIGIVFARAIIEGEDRGVKPFVVQINDGVNMSPGIVCKRLPPRGGSRPLNHSITYFHHVRLPYTALLGSPKKPKDLRIGFFQNIARVTAGTLAIGSLGVPALQVSSYIAARYSLRRTVADADGGRKPIMSFRTQRVPILTALAQSFVMKALHESAVPLYLDQTTDIRARNAIASIVKVVMIQHGQAANLGLGDRCGAQGLFEVNQLTGMFADMRGTAIAEGDTLALSVRLASELLLRRYAVPPPSNTDSLLAKHEIGMLQELQGYLVTMRHHRSDDFDRVILPECQPLVQAIGHRMAYEAAVAANVDQCLIDVYVASCVKLDSAWYVEKLGLSRLEQREMEAKAIDAMFPRLEEFLELTEVEPYITAPIVSEEKWTGYIASLAACGKPQVCEPTVITRPTHTRADDSVVTLVDIDAAIDSKVESNTQTATVVDLRPLGTVV